MEVNHPSCCLYKDAFSSSFKSILKAGDFNIEKTRVQRSDDSGVVDDMPPEAPSPSSTASNASSSGSNLSTGFTTDPSKTTTTTDNPLDKATIRVSVDRMQSSENRKDKSGTESRSVKSSLISTPLNVVETGPAATQMTLAVESGEQSQLTKNIVVVVKSTMLSVRDDTVASSTLVENVVGVNQQSERLKNNRSPQNVTLTPISTALPGSTPVQAFTASNEITCSPKSMAQSRFKRRQQSVDAERLVTQSSGLRRMESSPCDLTAAAHAAAGPAAKEASLQLSISNNGRVTSVVPRSHPAVLKITAPLSTSATSSSQPATVVASRTCTTTSAAGPVSRLAVHVPVQSERVPSSCISNKASVAAQQRRLSTPVENSSVKNVGHPISPGDTRKRALSDNNGYDKPKDETKTDLSEGERVSKVSSTTQSHQIHSNAPPPACRQILLSMPNAEVSRNVVIGRVKKISAREEHATPVTSGSLVSEKLSRKPSLLGITSRVPPSVVDEHTGPVISDVFESLRQRQEQQATTAAALSNGAKVPVVVAAGLPKPRQRPTRSARPKTGRSSVVSVSARTKHPPSRQPSAAAIRYRKPKTPTSAASSTVGINARTPRGRKNRKDCANRGRRKRSKSSTRKEEFEVEPEVAAGASDVTLIGGIGWQISTKCADVSDVHAVAKLRYEPAKNDKTEASNVSERTKCNARSGMSHTRTRSFEMPSVVPEHVCDPAGSRKDDAFTCAVNAVEADECCVGKYKRSTSSGDAEHHEIAVLALTDQQRNCKNHVPGLTSRQSREDGNHASRLTSRRKSQSADPMCSGDDTIVPGVNDDGVQPVSAAAADPQSVPRDRSLSKRTGESVTGSSALDRSQGAEVTPAIDELAKSQPCRRSSRRSRPAHRGTDAEHFDRDGVAKVITASGHAPPHVDQQQPIASTTPGNGNEAVQRDSTSGDVDDDVDRSPRFVRKRDSVGAASSTGGSCVDSRRHSLDKALGAVTTLDGDATISWHNSLFDNTTTANDTVGIDVLPNFRISRGPFNSYISLFTADPVNALHFVILV